MIFMYENATMKPETHYFCMLNKTSENKINIEKH